MDPPSAVNSVASTQPAASTEEDLHHSASASGAAEQASAEATEEPASEQAGSMAEEQEAAQQQPRQEHTQAACMILVQAERAGGSLSMRLFKQAVKVAYVAAGHVAGAAAVACAAVGAIASWIF